MRMVVLIALLITCSGCVVWYKDFPRPSVTAGQQGTTDRVLPAHPGFEQCVFQPVIPEWQRKLLAVTEGGYLLIPYGWLDYPRMASPWRSIYMEVPVQGGTVIFASHPSEAGMQSQEGLVCTARIAIAARDFGIEEWANAIPWMMTFTIVPMVWLPDGVEYSVTFSLSNSQGVTREYPYSFHKAGIAGLSMLPFAWINFFTSSEKEAFQAIFQQFLFDLQRDRAVMLPERQSHAQ